MGSSAPSRAVSCPRYRLVIFPGFPADSHAVSKASGTPTVGIDLPVEAEPHLRAVLERQPVVLTRVSKEGTFLAINEAGLSTLGAQSLEQILGTSLMNMVPSEERKACQGLLDRAMGGQRGSFEVDLVGLTGSRHTFELRANAHPLRAYRPWQPLDAERDFRA